MPRPISIDNLAAQNYGYSTSNMTTSFSDAYYNHVAFVDASSSTSLSDSRYLFNASNTLLTSSKVTIGGISGSWYGYNTLQRYKSSSYSNHGYYLFNNSTSATDANARRVYSFFIVPTAVPATSGYNIPIFSTYTSAGHYLNIYYGYNTSIRGSGSGTVSSGSHIGFYFVTSKYNNVYELRGMNGNNYLLNAGHCYSITISHYADDIQIFIIDLGVNGNNNDVTSWPSNPSWYTSTVDHTYNGDTKVSYSSSTSPATGTTAYYVGVNASGFIKTAVLAAFKSGGAIETSTYYALRGYYGGMMVLTYAYNKTAADTKGYISSIARQRPYKVTKSSNIYTVLPMSIISTGFSFIVASTTAETNVGYYLQAESTSASYETYQRGTASFYSSSSYAYYSSSVQTSYTAMFSTAYAHATWTADYGDSCVVPSGNYIAFKSGLKKNSIDIEPIKTIMVYKKTTTPPENIHIKVDSTDVQNANFNGTSLAAIRYAVGSTVYCPYYGIIKSRVRMNAYNSGINYAIRVRRSSLVLDGVMQYDSGCYYILPRAASSSIGAFYDFRIGDQLHYLSCNSTSTTGTETHGGYFNQSLMSASVTAGTIISEGTGRTHNRMINPTTYNMTYYSVVDKADILGYRTLSASSATSGATYKGTYYHWGCPSSSISTAYSTLQSTEAYVGSSSSTCSSSSVSYVALG